VRSFSAPTKKCRRTALVSFLESIRDAPDSRSRAHSWVRANHQFLWSLHRAVSRGGCSPLPGRRPGKKLQLARAIYSHPWLYPMCTDRVNCILFGYAAFGNHEHLFQDALEKLASPTLVMQQEQTRRDKLLNWLNYSIKLGPMPSPHIGRFQDTSHQSFCRKSSLIWKNTAATLQNSFQCHNWATMLNIHGFT